MSQVTLYECEQCQLRVPNNYAHPGWIHFTGDLTRSVGRYGKSCYETAYLGSLGGRGLGHDFCSLQCLRKKLDELKPIHVEVKSCEACGSTLPIGGEGGSTP